MIYEYDIYTCMKYEYDIYTYMKYNAGARSSLPCTLSSGTPTIRSMKCRSVCVCVSLSLSVCVCVSLYRSVCVCVCVYVCAYHWVSVVEQIGSL